MSRLGGPGKWELNDKCAGGFCQTKAAAERQKCVPKRARVFELSRQRHDLHYSAGHLRCPGYSARDPALVNDTRINNMFDWYWGHRKDCRHWLYSDSLDKLCSPADNSRLYSDSSVLRHCNLIVLHQVLSVVEPGSALLGAGDSMHTQLQATSVGPDRASSGRHDSLSRLRGVWFIAAIVAVTVVAAA